MRSILFNVESRCQFVRLSQGRRTFRAQVTIPHSARGMDTLATARVSASCRKRPTPHPALGIPRWAWTPSLQLGFLPRVAYAPHAYRTHGFLLPLAVSPIHLINCRAFLSNKS